MINNSQLMLKEGERLDDLLFEDMHIIQNKNMYCFTSDAVLLANFAKATSKDVVIDMCSGSGIVGILFYGKNKCKKVTLLEVQPQFADMAKRSVLLNNLQDKIDVVNLKVQQAPDFLPKGGYDVVLCNPPYKIDKAHKISEDKHIAMCKYELTLTFDELCKSVSKLLKYGGKFYFVHESNRIAELITIMKQYNLEPKILEFCYPSTKTESNVVLVKAVKNGKSGCIVKRTTN